jgi:hypothetical protein
MSGRDLIDAVAEKLSEDPRGIHRRGCTLTGPEDSSPEPACLLDVLLVDLPAMGTVDWDAVLGDGGFRTPFYARGAKAKAATSEKKQVARAARPATRWEVSGDPSE